MKHAARATRYARDVVAGKVPAGKWVRLACQRHLDDLAASANKRYAYVYDESEANRACEIIELFPHTKGRWAAKNEPIVLEPWQCFLVCSLFGWQRRKDGKRRFRHAYWLIPRKNGKSVLAAAIGILFWAFDGEHGAEVYCGATSEKQAWEVFRPAKLMIERSERLRQTIGAEVRAKSLVIPADLSRFEAVIGKPGDGSSPSCAIADEYHEHDTPDLVDTMETGMGAREQPLMLKITTAGYNLAGPCFEDQQQAQKVLEGAVKNDELFAVIYSIDEGDDWANPKSLRKANPNFGVSVDEEWLLAQQRQAISNTAQQTRFRTKHLNQWCSSNSALFNLQHWFLAGDTMLSIDEMQGAECWVGVDLASKVDLCSAQILFRRILADKPHYYLFGRYWLPEAAVEDAGPNQASYRSWHLSGHLTVTEGATVDLSLITQTVLADMKEHGAIEMIYDPFNGLAMAQAVMAEGATAVEFNQNAGNFAIPVDELQAALKDGRFHHDGNPMTTWCISNVVGRPTRKGLMAPMKQSAHLKIDGAIAACMAMSRAATSSESVGDVFVEVW